MNLLFDQNISFRLVKAISSVFPEAKHLRDLGLEDSTDIYIWNFAKENNYAIVTFDADFIDLLNLHNSPPKLIWLRTGNRSTSYLTELILSRSEAIIDFLTNPTFREITCLEID